jgi:hypothetical protein
MLRIDEILSKLNGAVTTWAAANKATVSIARDPFHVLEILAESPAGFRVILHWAGDKNPSEILQMAIARNDIEVIFSYNLGLTGKPDLALITGSTARPALLALLDDLRALILSIQYPDEETLVYCVYAGTEPFITPDGIPLAAYRMRFQLDSGINTQSTITV